MKKNEILRRIPKIDEVLKAGGLELLFAGAAAPSLRRRRAASFRI